VKTKHTLVYFFKRVLITEIIKLKKRILECEINVMFLDTFVHVAFEFILNTMLFGTLK